ncbi:MAG: hypothetical protein AAB553_02910 [Patescibacteria group bacterium]
MLSAKEVTDFRQKILTWYTENKRILPWRALPFDEGLQLRDPYKILISEVMSQQTQIDRVIPKYEAWIKKFPTVSHVAEASVADVLTYWSGLGYNRRVLNLKKTAEVIVKKYQGKFPQEETELLLLPGIGSYTARAMLCFAFNQQVVVVDTNVRKVILTQIAMKRHSGEDEGRLQNPDSGHLPAMQSNALQAGARMTDKEIEEIAIQLLPAGQAYEWNQALMDYAGSVLKKEKIAVPKQSKFVGSHRYYRGQILKLLLQKKQLKINEVGPLIKQDYAVDEEAWLQNLVAELVREGFIAKEDGSIKLVS